MSAVYLNASVFCALYFLKIILGGFSKGKMPSMSNLLIFWAFNMIFHWYKLELLVYIIWTIVFNFNSATLESLLFAAVGLL